MDAALQNALELARWERELADASYVAMRKWLPQAEAAVLPSLTAAADAPPPDLDRLSDVEYAWRQLLGGDVLPVLERLMVGRITRRWQDAGLIDLLPEEPEDSVRLITTGKRSRDARTAYRLASVRARSSLMLDQAAESMARHPMAVQNLLAAAVDAGRKAGETGPGLRQRVLGVLRGGKSLWMKKAEDLSRTVATGAFNGAQLFSSLARQELEGIPLEKVWTATIDQRTRPSHFAADGQRRRLEDPFRVGGFDLDRPGDPNAPIQEIASCRCTIIEIEAGDALPSENDRQTERGPGDSTVKNRQGSQQDEIRRRADEGIVRAREDPDGEGQITASAAPMGAGMDMEWEGVLAPLGTPTGDDRIFSEDMEVSFRDFPLPLMWQRQTSDFPHSQAYTVGSIRTAEVVDGEIKATGIIFGDTEVSEEVLSQLREGVTRPSVDLCEDVWELVGEDGEKVDEEEMWFPFENEDDDEDAEPKKVFMQFTAAKIMGATLVAKPAFGEAKIVLKDEPDPTEDDETEDDADKASIRADGSDEFAAVKHDGNESTPDTKPKKTPAEEQEPGTEPDDGPDGGAVGKGKPKTNKPSPTATRKPDAPDAADAPKPLKGDNAPDGSTDRTASSTKSDDDSDDGDDEKKPAKKGGDKKGGGFPWDKASYRQKERSLLAAAPAIKVYSADLFSEPTDLLPNQGHRYDKKTGRVYGYIAAWNECHRAVQTECILPPRSQTNYADFHQHWVETDQGVLHVGALTVGCGHAEDGRPMQVALEHYDNAGSVWAKVRVGENEHGIWYSGVVMDHVEPKLLAQAIGTPLSGDWRQHGGRGGQLELCAALSVVTPGYARPHGAHDEHGRPASLVAAAIPQVPNRRRKGQQKQATSAEIAQQAVQMYAERQAALSRVQRVASQIEENDRKRAAIMQRRLSMRVSG